jgi:hypothetical protein
MKTAHAEQKKKNVIMYQGNDVLQLPGSGNSVSRDMHLI